MDPLERIWHDHPLWFRNWLNLEAHPWRFVPAHMAIVFLSLLLIFPLINIIGPIGHSLPEPFDFIPVAIGLLIFALIAYMAFLLPWRVLHKDMHIAFLCMFLAPWINAAYFLD